jgi:phosphoribosylformylglycinamidine synthase
MLSESQERMLLVCAPDRVDEVIRMLDHWSLSASDIGEITDDGLVRVREGDDVVCEVPVALFIDECPTYHVVATEPEAAKKRRTEPIDPSGFGDVQIASELEALMAEPNIGTRRSIWEQYDHTILTNTVVGPGGDAAVMRVKGTPLGVVTSIDCNSRYCDIDPYNGARLAVAEAARNVACAGGRPLAITNCLNMGNPEQEPGSWHLQESVRGIADACRDLDIPVVSGNVSLYNETLGVPIQPTPMIGCVGVVDDVAKATRSPWQEGDLLLGIMPGEPTLGGSEWLAARKGRASGAVPAVDTALETQLQSFARACALDGAVRVVHDISQGGLAVTIAEEALFAGLGADLSNASPAGVNPVAFWFGERASAIVLGVDPAAVYHVSGLAEAAGLPVIQLGTVTGDALRFPDGSTVNLSALRAASESALDLAVASSEIVPA